MTHTQKAVEEAKKKLEAATTEEEKAEAQKELDAAEAADAESGK